MSYAPRLGVLPRWLHRFYARLIGYAWGPCPLCGRSFGGHEWRDRKGLSSTITKSERPGKRTGTAICPICTRAGYGDPTWKVDRHD